MTRSGSGGSNPDRPVAQTLPTKVVSVAAPVGLAAFGMWLGLWVVGASGTVGAAAIVLTPAALLVAEVAARPLLRRLASHGSVLLALVLGLVGQVVITGLALYFVADVTTVGWRRVVVVLGVAGVVTAAGRWALGASDTAYVVGHALRRRKGGIPAGAGERGLVVLQFDGVSAEVLGRTIASGQAPTLASLLHAGSHVLRDWWVPLPSTTPASQAGILHGDDTQMPGFRWWDRSVGKLMVSNRSADAAVIESRLPRGRGLLREGGVAVSTIFSGQAQDALLVFSKASQGRV